MEGGPFARLTRQSPREAVNGGAPRCVRPTNCHQHHDATRTQRFRSVPLGVGVSPATIGHAALHGATVRFGGSIRLSSGRFLPRTSMPTRVPVSTFEPRLASCRRVVRIVHPEGPTPRITNRPRSLPEHTRERVDVVTTEDTFARTSPGSPSRELHGTNAFQEERRPSPTPLSRPSVGPDLATLRGSRSGARRRCTPRRSPALGNRSLRTLRPESERVEHDVVVRDLQHDTNRGHPYIERSSTSPKEATPSVVTPPLSGRHDGERSRRLRPLRDDTCVGAPPLLADREHARTGRCTGESRMSFREGRKSPGST